MIAITITKPKEPLLFINASSVSPPQRGGAGCAPCRAHPGWLGFELLQQIFKGLHRLRLLAVPKKLNSAAANGEIGIVLRDIRQDGHGARFGTAADQKYECS